jgi:putative ABC transport system substrate-binding protein
MTRRWLAACLALLAVAVAGTPADAQTVPWLHLDAATASRWQAKVDPADPLRLTLTLRGKPAGGAPILVVLPWQSSAYDTATRTVLRAFADHGRGATFTIASMDGDAARGAALFRDAAGAGYRLVFAMGSEAAKVAHDTYRSGVVPVVTVCAKDPVQLGQVARYDRGSGTDIAYTSLNMPTEAQFSYLLELMPGLRNIAILVDSTNKSAVETQAKPLEAAARAKGVTPIILAVPGRKGMREAMPEKMAAAIAAMRASDPNLRRSFFWITGSTAVFTEIGIINAHAGKVPVLSVVPDVVRAGEASAALAVGISFESNARLAAAYAFDILDGKAKPGDLKVGVVEPPDIAINFRKARESGLRIPYSFFELAWYVFDARGEPARIEGRDIARAR